MQQFSPHIPPILSFDGPELFEDGSMMCREQILTRLSRYATILHSMPPLPRGRRFGNGGVVKYDDGLFGFRNPPWLPEVYSNAMAQRVFAALRRRYRGFRLKQLAGPQRPIHYIWHPIFADEAMCAGDGFIVYHIYDDYRQQDGATPDLIARERRLLERADLVFCSSQATLEKRQREVRRRYHLVTHGVDESFLDARKHYAEPSDLTAITGPRLAYIGRINRKVDFQKMAAIVERNPEWQLVFVGPFTGSPQEKTAFQTLCERPNVHWLGNKAVDELPAYCAHVDVSVLCYTMTGWSFDGTPLKLVESLACGTPVVASATAGCAPFAEYIAMCESVADWETALRGILAAGRSSAKTELGIAFARTQTWDQKCAEVLEILTAAYNEHANR